MKKILPVALVVLTSTYISNASSSELSDWYVGAIYSSQDISIHGREFETVGGTIGYKYNEFISFETRISFGVSGFSADVPYQIIENDILATVSNGYIEQDVSTQVSLLIKASYPLTNNFNIYALAGVSSTKSQFKGGLQYSLSGSVESQKDIEWGESDTDNGLTYGAGLNYKFSGGFSLFIDYQLFPELDNYSEISDDWSSVNAGFNYNF